MLESESWKESGWSEDLRIDAYEEADEVLEDVRDLMGIGAVSCFLILSFLVDFFWWFEGVRMLISRSLG